ncbi:NlpC/P60 family protein [Luteolibacter luteus]|uniref:C40 family peptidase n=1 Tax=Luteolibacter luteus TaxID=2728835 RepID=A0A858REW6_9BACT|nr:NlpC/P60 family protein [Luteolibacter luteus]QJE95636.1 C40 family peptidase [Luteolibacter luteus]
MKRRSWGIRLMVWAGAAAAFLIWRPIHDGLMRYGLTAALGLVWLGLLIVLWPKKKARLAALALPLFLALPFLLPGRDLDQAHLKHDYLSGMRRFTGSTYVWGGESSRGIDCSGLPRRALRDALAQQALTGNGKAARLWLEQWWFDTSARAMQESYRGFTKAIGVAGRMTDLDLAKIQPGDLAVTGDGRHVMIYLDKGEWIQADPGPGQVIVATPGRDDNAWFNSYVSLHRWTSLEAPGGSN